MNYSQADYLKAIGVQRWSKRPDFFGVPVNDEVLSNESVIEETVLGEGVAEPRTVDYVPQNVSDVPVGSLTDPVSPISVEPVLTSSTSALDGLSFPELEKQVLDGVVCQSCHVNGAVFGQGDTQADWLFINDAPKSQEVKENALIQGRAGQLFDAILLALGLKRESVYLTTFFKCSASNPLTTEQGENGKLLEATCGDALEQQIRQLKPKVIVTLGEFTAQSLLKRNESLDKLRTQQNQLHYSDAVVVPICQIQEMLDQPELKAQVWHDLSQTVKSIAN